MPMQTRTRNGVTYYRWGSSGKWYRSKKDAEKQRRAIFASGYRGK